MELLCPAGSLPALKTASKEGALTYEYLRRQQSVAHPGLKNSAVL